CAACPRDRGTCTGSNTSSSRDLPRPGRNGSFPRIPGLRARPIAVRKRLAFGAANYDILALVNFLVIMSDEHNPKVAGYAGHPLAYTPSLDALAARGTTFSSAYTTSPVCIPARAGFACGKYIHQIGFWDNADAYDGSVPSWHHLLRSRGHRVDS